MASNSRRRQTMAKLKRERAVKEKRALKLEKKEARKQAALDALNGTPAEGAAPPEELQGPESSPAPAGRADGRRE
jgi:hypothetical protein